MKKSTLLTKWYHLVTPFCQNYVYLTTRYMHITKNKIYNKIQFKTNLNKINKIKNKNSSAAILNLEQFKFKSDIQSNVDFFFFLSNIALDVKQEVIGSDATKGRRLPDGDCSIGWRHIQTVRVIGERQTKKNIQYSHYSLFYETLKDTNNKLLQFKNSIY